MSKANELLEAVSTTDTKIIDPRAKHLMDQIYVETNGFRPVNPDELDSITHIIKNIGVRVQRVSNGFVWVNSKDKNKVKLELDKHDIPYTHES